MNTDTAAGTPPIDTAAPGPPPADADGAVTDPAAAGTAVPPSTGRASNPPAPKDVADPDGGTSVPDAQRDEGHRQRPRPHIRVMTTGVFDLLHPGHIHMLEEAKGLGDELVVVIARDESAQKEKHTPITPEDHRRHMVQNLKPVDQAVLGHRGDYYQIVEELRPDVFALGFDQKYDESDIQAEFDRRGIHCKVVRLPKFVGDLVGSRKIVEKVAKRLSEKSLYTEDR